MSLEKLSKKDIAEAIVVNGMWDYELNYGYGVCKDCLICLDDCKCEDSTDIQHESYLKYVDEDGKVITEIMAVKDDLPLIYDLSDNRRAFYTEIEYDLIILYNENICDGVVEGCYNFDDFEAVGDEGYFRKENAKNNWVK